MILIDANLLLYAHHPGSPEHERAREWLEARLSGPGAVFLAWSTIHAFLRIITNPRVFERPLKMDEASAIVSSWLDLPTVSTVEPGERHWPILRDLLTKGRVAGPLVADAALAALAIEHGATIASTDRDFSRFPGLRWVNPIEGEASA